MALLLNLVERESNLIFEGGEPDYELVHDVMHYMTVYPDAVHHPKEDRLYAELKAARPDLASGFERITMDHRSISESGVKLRDELAAINAGTFLKRKTVVANALRYVNMLRDHMQWEELDLFGRCEEMATQGHPLITTGNFVSVADPLFKGSGESNFNHLLKNIEHALHAE